jgi:hypothetical protein
VPVDAINTCGVSAGHFAWFRVVSRTFAMSNSAFPEVSAISMTGSIPGSSTE